MSNRILTRLENLATCLCAAILEANLPEPCFCGIVPGEAVVEDYIGDCEPVCGMAFVRLASIYPATSLGQPSDDVNNCGLMLGADIEIGILRCISSGEADGSPPSPEELYAATQLQINDSLAIYKAVNCCDLGDVLMDTYSPVGPLGGIVGGIWPISIMDQ